MKSFVPPPTYSYLVDRSVYAKDYSSEWIYKVKFFEDVKQTVPSGTYSIGKFTSYDSKDDYFQLTDGDFCPRAAILRSGKLSLLCSENNDVFVDVTEDPLCYYTVVLQGKMFCQSEGKSIEKAEEQSSQSLILGIIIILIVLSAACGVYICIRKQITKTQFSLRQLRRARVAVAAEASSEYISNFPTEFRGSRSLIATDPACSGRGEALTAMSLYSASLNLSDDYLLNQRDFPSDWARARSRSNSGVSSYRESRSRRRQFLPIETVDGNNDGNFLSDSTSIPQTWNLESANNNNTAVATAIMLVDDSPRPNAVGLRLVNGLQGLPVAAAVTLPLPVAETVIAQPMALRRMPVVASASQSL